MCAWYRISFYLRVSDVTWTSGHRSNAVHNGGHLQKKTKYMYIVLVDICFASVSQLLLCFSQKWYVCCVISYSAYGP